jgi:GAF domain-containing protein
MSRESLLARTFVELADTLVDDFDVVDLLSRLAERTVEVLDVSAAGIILASADGELKAIASSSETMRLVELFELQSEEGPCLDCYRTRRAVLNEVLGEENGRWPRFESVALDAGFRTVHALPMKLRSEVIGALNLFSTDTRALDDGDLATAQALADVATIAILQNRAVLETRRLNEQLDHALKSRIVIEQAKGVLAERAGVGIDGAFAMLRGYARDHNRKLVDISTAVIDGTLSVLALTQGALDRHPPHQDRAAP